MFLRREGELPSREEVFCISFGGSHPAFSVTGKPFLCFLAALVLCTECPWPDSLCVGRGVRRSPLCPARTVYLRNRARLLPVQTALLRAPQQDLCVPGCDRLYQHHWHFQTVPTHPDDSELGLWLGVLVGLLCDVETQVPGLLCGCQDELRDTFRRSAAEGLTCLLKGGRENSSLTERFMFFFKEEKEKEEKLLTIISIHHSKGIFFYFSGNERAFFQVSIVFF